MISKRSFQFIEPSKLLKLLSASSTSSPPFLFLKPSANLCQFSYSIFFFKIVLPNLNIILAFSS